MLQSDVWIPFAARSIFDVEVTPLSHSCPLLIDGTPAHYQEAPAAGESLVYSEQEALPREEGRFGIL